MQVYDRIYYTLYRTLIGFGQVNEIDIPRSNAAILLTLFTGLNVVAVLTLLSGITGIDMITGNRIQAVTIGMVIAILIFFQFFTKRGLKKLRKGFQLPGPKIGTKIYYSR